MKIIMKIVIITASFLAAAVFTRAGQILSPTAAGIMIGLQPANNTFRGIESNFTIPEMLIAGTLNSSDFPTNQVNISVGLGMDDNFRFSNPTVPWYKLESEWSSPKQKLAFPCI